MRNVNIGYRNSSFGYTLKVNGATGKIKAIGEQDDEGNYEIPWYENIEEIPNCDRFDGFGKKPTGEDKTD